MMSLTIRNARAGDAAELARVAERTFRDTFGPVNSVEGMALHCAASYGEAIQAAEISATDRVTLLCVDGERLVGFAQLRWGHAPECVRVQGRAPGEIQRLYVIAEWQGRGVAQRLMDACLAEMSRRESDVVWLGVWERNPRAIAFYRKFGFVEVGAHVFPLGRDPQRDIIMVRPTRLATVET